MTPIYHITHLRNLELILQAGGMYCDWLMAERRIQHIAIAHQHIKLRRAKRKVPTCKGGTLADYAPFYFAPRSPMLYVIHRGGVQGYPEGQGPLLHLVSAVEAVQHAQLPFTFTDGHAVMAFSEFFEDLADLAKVDWNVMKSKWWNDTATDMDRERRRQAEFLVYQFFPWTLVQKIGVIDQPTAQEVNRILSRHAHSPEVVIERSWYY